MIGYRKQMSLGEPHLFDDAACNPPTPMNLIERTESTRSEQFEIAKRRAVKDARLATFWRVQGGPGDFSR